METQKFIVTSKRNDYLYAYHTEYEVGDDNDREIAMKAIERCKPPLLDLRIETYKTSCPNLLDRYTPPPIQRLTQR